MPKRRHLKTIAENTKGAGMFFVRRPKIAALVGITLAIWGFLSAWNIPKESAPYIEYGVVSISTVYPGASAIDVDQLVTQEIEKKIKGISGLNTYSSVSRDGISSITLEFNPGQDMTKAVGDIRSKVDEAKPFLPNEIDSDPKIVEIDSSLESFLSLVLFGDIPTEQLTDYAYKLKDTIERVPNVAQVNISGAKEREIAVVVDKQKIDALGISLTQVQNAIRAAHADVPIGNFDIDHYEYSIRFIGKLKTPEAVKNVVITNVHAGKNIPSLITVGDIADVFERAEDTKTISRFAVFQEEDNRFYPAVEVAVSKRSQTDILAVDGKTRQAAEEFAQEKLPSEVHMKMTRKMADTMRDDYKQVIVSGLESVIVVMLFIFFFVGIMEGLVASIVIPITFLITIGVLAFFGKTLNFMTNFSMILSLGILVDTAIVIVEGAHHFIREGYSKKNAALLALHEYRGPLLAGTLTTLAVFIPLLSLSGVLGQYLSFIPVTVIIVLVSSLFASLLLLPAYAATLLPKPEDEKRKDEKRKIWFPHTKERLEKIRVHIDHFIEEMDRQYTELLKKLLATRKRRLISLGAVVIAFFLSFTLPIPFVLFPQSDQPYLNIQAEMPEGSTTENTNILAQHIEKILRKYPEILFVQNQVQGKTATLQLELLTEKERKKAGMRDSITLEKELSKALSPLEKNSGASIRTKSAQKGPPSAFPVGFQVIAHDQNAIEDAKETAQKLTEVLRDIPHTASVKNDIEEIPGEFTFRINREKAIALGIHAEDIAKLVRTALQGSTAATFSQNGRDVDIVVELNEKNIEHITDIFELQIPLLSGGSVPLQDVISFQRNDALAAIRRSDGNIAFTVSSLLGENGNAQEITDAFLKRLNAGAVEIPKNIEVENAGENQENASLIQDLVRGFVIAILLMFLILVVQFNAFIQPLLILFTILFAQIGVGIGLFLTGTPRSLAYILGAIALAGIVVNDAIIMIDQMNKNRRQKEKDLFSHSSSHTKELDEKTLVSAVVDAGTSRFIPVVLTTLTTSAGIIPLIFQDTFWAGLSYTIVFGLTVASFLTLFLTPATYVQFQKEAGLTMIFFLSAALMGVALSSMIRFHIISALLFGALSFMVYILFFWKLQRQKLEK